MDNHSLNDIEKRGIEIENLMKDIFSHIKVIFATNLSYMSIALDILEVSAFTKEEIEILTLQGKTARFGTDGIMLLYNPEYILDNFKNMPRNILHSLLHCVLHHIFTNYSNFENTALLDLAMDIFVENIIEEIVNDSGNCLTNFKCGISSIKRKIIKDVSGASDIMSVDAIYGTLTFLTQEEFEDYEEIFKVDDHIVWSFATGNGRNLEGDESQPNDDDSSSDNPDDNSDDNSGDNSGDKSDDNSETDENDNSSDREEESQEQNNNKDVSKEKYDKDIQNKQREQAKQKWDDISEMISQDMKNSDKNAGDSSNSLEYYLNNIREEKYSYEEFLNLFAIENEAMKLNEDEFDLGYYSYGLELYENMPFIEPLEYQDIKQIKDFVIAIDTSGSIKRDLALSFLTKTYNILTTRESFGSKVNIHIIQCDTEIQEVIKITDLDDVKQYIQNFKVKGLGGTDFRPVFNYINERVLNGEFSELKGMIYFTDTFGEFPVTPPTYETVIVYSKKDLGNYQPMIPNWALGFDLDKTDLD